jgi:peptide/nickel transport system permease protein
MTNPLNTSHTQPLVANHLVSRGLWGLAWRRLRADCVAMLALVIVLAYLLMLVLSATGLVAKNWDQEVGVNYAPPTFIGAQSDAERGFSPTAMVNLPLPDNPVDPLSDVIRQLRAEGAKTSDMATNDDKNSTTVVRQKTLLFGADKWGHDIIQKTIKGSETSIIVGLIAAILAVVIGTVLGAFSGYCGGRIDALLEWFYNVFTSIPYLLLILAVAAVLQQKGIMSIVLILGLTGWTGTYRLVRAEYIKHRLREYVLAADAIGASHRRKMFTHIFPNISHVPLVQMSILVVGFIKAEVILSFLGFGVPVGVVSWGSMLNEAPNELILGKWWQLTAATVAMAVLVTAFSLFTDALRDALDPKLK